MQIGDVIMPIIRKIIQVGTSKAVTIPKGWLEYLRKETGCDVTEVAIEVDRVLKIMPILPENEKKGASENEMPKLQK